jgi:hypothetical protein
MALASDRQREEILEVGDERSKTRSGEHFEATYKAKGFGILNEIDGITTCMDSEGSPQNNHSLHGCAVVVGLW